MKLSDALIDKKMDLRLRDKHIAEGKLKSAEVADYLETLKDDADNSKIIEIPLRKEKAKKPTEL